MAGDDADDRLGIAATHDEPAIRPIKPKAIEAIALGIRKMALDRVESAGELFRWQLGRPFEQEARLRELLIKQADINRSLDLDKSDTQVVAEEKVA